MGAKIPSKMNESQTIECISHKLIKIYKTDVGKKFIHHLVNAFSKQHIQVITINTGQSQLLDCITNRILRPIYNSRDEFPKEDIMGDIKAKMVYDIAIGSKISDKILGKCEYDQLMIWINGQLEAGNEEIKKIVDYNSKSFKKKSNKAHNSRKVNKSYKKNKSISKLTNIKKS